MRDIVISAIAAAVVVTVMVIQSIKCSPSLSEAPLASLTDIDGFTAETIEPSEAERNVLPSDTILDKRRYVDDVGNWYVVSLVVGGRSKSSIHRPELCLPSQGFQMTSPRQVEAAGTDWQVVTLMRRAQSPLGFAYTFFNQAGFRTSSHVRRIMQDVWDRSIHSRIDRWAMVTVVSSVADDSRICAFLAKLREVMR